MKSTWRLIWVTALLSLLCIASVALLTLRAAAQTTNAPPQTAEEEGVIPDDPVVAPDPQESADNNVTFPVDI